MRKLIVFDLDGTLADSKSSIDTETAGLLRGLLSVVQVAVISGGAWPQFERQLLAPLASGDYMNSLSLLPTCGTQFYQHRSGWERLYSEDLSAAQKTQIITALRTAIDSAGLERRTVWGEVIEDRGSQITFSALGQQAPLAQKQAWDPQF